MKKLFFIIFAFAMTLTSCSKSQVTNQNEGVEIKSEESLSKSESVSPSTTESVDEPEDNDGTPGNRTFSYIRKLGSRDKYKSAVENLTKDYLMGVWALEVISEEVNIIRIAFDDDGTYYWYSPYGGYMGERGKYNLDGNSVTLFYPNDTMSMWEELVFPDGKETTLVFDRDFKDFYCVGVLRNDQLILRNWVEERPVGSECILKGIEVIKTEEKSVVAKDNLKLRYEPSQKGREGSFWYPMFLQMNLRDELEDYDEGKLAEYNKSLMNAAIEKKVLVINEDEY